MKFASALGRLWKQRQSSGGRFVKFLGTSHPLGEWILPWCRLLNALPEADDTPMSRAEKQQGDTPLGKWIHYKGRDGYILSEGESGRYSPTLPTGVRPEDVVEVDVDSRATPGKDQLRLSR